MFLIHPLSDWTLVPIVELRERFEHRLERDFDASKEDARSDLFSRFRLGFESKNPAGARVKVVYQLAHDRFQLPGRLHSAEQQNLVFAEVELPVGGGKLVMGRQKWSLGDQRLVGPFEWNLYSRSYDGLRYIASGWTAFAGYVRVQPGLPKGSSLLGLSGKVPGWGGDSEAALLFKHHEDSDVWTADLRHRVSRGRWAFDGEAAIQRGHTSGKDLEAWAYHAAVSHTLSPWAKVFVETSGASGGSSDGTSRTFDNLYPTNHFFYGTMDLQGWRNMREVAFGAEFRASGQVRVRPSYRWLWLHDAKDAWYGAGGAPNPRAGGVFRDPTGSSGREVGTELDLDVFFDWDKQTALIASIGVFSPGKFVKSLAGSSDRQVWLMVSLQRRY